MPPKMNLAGKKRGAGETMITSERIKSVGLHSQTRPIAISQMSHDDKAKS